MAGDRYDRDDDAGRDKQWAKKYILDPLTEPEPSQECGPGSSFRNPNGLQRSLSAQVKPTSTNYNKPLPTPPVSSSPSKSRFRPKLPASHPTSPAGFDTSNSRRNLPDYDTEEDTRKLHKLLVRSLSVNESRTSSSSRQRREFPPSAHLNRSKTVHTARPRENAWNQGTILTRKDSVSSTRPRPETPNSFQGPRSPGSILASPLSSPLSSPVASPSPMASPVARNMDADKGKGLRRSGSLTARFPGDMSHRPLDTIKQDQRAAMRAPHLRNPRHKQPADTIDVLDQTGIADTPYHHEGPYDAASAPRNRKKLYSPLDAVKDSNEEAIKATPREYIQDSLTKHVPLQGTAVIPPGMRDMAGRRMEYQEGADLMREPDAPGGAYKRYEGIRYRDGDLKGKGEPSYTIERDQKEQKARLRKHTGSFSEGRDGIQVYEMQPTSHHGNNSGSNRSSRKDQGANVRQRSVSNVDEQAGPASPLLQRNEGQQAYTTGNTTDLRRRNTTGNKFTDGLKRRFGSLRRKKGPGGSGDDY
ncbi:hypothetical protein GE09DRAFT_1089402 [Coniochaeta sp. 2T2.1]|nr:hypothetical protein GE09DRAFT_1089402 [Coniochaeta sp. 2T2.1]